MDGAFLFSPQNTPKTATLPIAYSRLLFVLAKLESLFFSHRFILLINPIFVLSE